MGLLAVSQSGLLLLRASARHLQGRDLIRFFCLDLGLVGNRRAAHSGDLIRAARCLALLALRAAQPRGLHVPL
ncbi:hypothetical protein NBRC116187_20860 [Halopseudomonas sabulinigri]|uniref:Uncharacterized protein n=1 Tax=Halopseudomonas sabulinigri TaxID=472181 RepID=A0A1H1XU81_9GAMM|nr:hypothetical protein [Halopseudomonas sabulinigri]SDT12804.1 hypothetical protein SAMN05216271_3673 [Halopseudomonas sabulinigri]